MSNSAPSRPYRVCKKPPANLPAKEPIQPSRAEATIKTAEDGLEFVHRFSNGAKVWTTIPRSRAAFNFCWMPLAITYPPPEEITNWLVSVAKIVAEQHSSTVGLTVARGADHEAMIVPPNGEHYRAQDKTRIEGPFISLRIEASRWVNTP